jgi:hypothetical protein
MATSYVGLIEEARGGSRMVGGHDPGRLAGSPGTAAGHHPTEHFFDNR